MLRGRGSLLTNFQNIRRDSCQLQTRAKSGFPSPTTNVLPTLPAHWRCWEKAFYYASLVFAEFKETGGAKLPFCPSCRARARVWSQTRRLQILQFYFFLFLFTPAAEKVDSGKDELSAAAENLSPILQNFYLLRPRKSDWGGRLSTVDLPV